MLISFLTYSFALTPFIPTLSTPAQRQVLAIRVACQVTFQHLIFFEVELLKLPVEPGEVLPGGPFSGLEVDKLVVAFGFFLGGELAAGGRYLRRLIKGAGVGWLWH
jgi:hypothetical protein